MEQANEVESPGYPTDVTGFEKIMIDLALLSGDGFSITNDQVHGIIDMITKRSELTRNLEAYKLGVERTKEFGIGEAVLKKFADGTVGAGIVVNTSVARVQVHLWYDSPTRSLMEPTAPVMKQYSPDNIKPIRTGSEWSQWVAVMGSNGHYSWPPWTQQCVMEGAGFDAIGMTLRGAR